MRNSKDLCLFALMAFLMQLVAAGCESQSIQPSPTPDTVVPARSPEYSPRVGVLTPTEAVPISKVCRAQDLEASWVGENGATMGLMLAQILLLNKSSTACVVSGVPDIRLLDEKGNPVTIKLIKANNCAPFNECAPDQIVELLPGLGTPVPNAGRLTRGQGILSLQWRITDGAQPCPLLGNINKLVVILTGSDDELVIKVSSLTISRASCGVVVHEFDGAH